MTIGSKRILMLIDQFFPVLGGAEQQAFRLGKELIERGYKISVLTRRSTDDLAETEIYEDIRIYRLPFMGTGGASKLKSTLPAAAWLVKNKDCYDIIHCHGSNPLEWSAMIAKQITGKPYVLKLTNPNFMNYAGANNGFKMKAAGERNAPREVLRSLMLPALRFMRKNMIKHAARILAISPQIVERLSEYGFNHVSNIPNGIDTEIFTPASPEEKQQLRQKLGLEPDSVIFIYAGRFAIEKNLMNLLRAWKLLSESNSELKAKLLLLGSSNGQIYSAEDDLKKYAADNNLDSLSFLGSVFNVDEYLKASDVFVLPSYWEGMSNALLEAMACGLPAIVSDIPANNALVENNTSGLTFEVDDVDTLVWHLSEIANDENKRSVMGKRAREFALNRYSFPVIMDSITETYEQILGFSIPFEEVV